MLLSRLQLMNLQSQRAQESNWEEARKKAMELCLATQPLPFCFRQRQVEGKEGKEKDWRKELC